MRSVPVNLRLRFLLPYLPLLALLVLISSVFLNYTIEISRKTLIEKNMLILGRSQRSIDSLIRQLEHESDMLQSSAPVILYRQVTDPFDGPVTIRTIGLQKELLSYFSAFEPVIDAYLIYRKSDISISKSLITPVDDLFNQYLRYEQIDGWNSREHFLERWHRKEFIPARRINAGSGAVGRSASVITYLSSLGSMLKPEGVLLILIDNEQVLESFSSLDLSDGGFVYITDSSNRVISRTANCPLEGTGLELSTESQTYETELEGNRVIISYTVSSATGWRYVAVQPKQVILGETETLKRILIIIITLSTISGIVVSILLSRKSSTIVANLITILAGKGGQTVDVSGNPYDYIEGRIENLIDQNTELRRAMRDHQDMLERAFMEKLIRGTFQDKAEADDFKKLISHPIPESGRIGIIYIDTVSTAAAGGLVSALSRQYLFRNLLHEQMNLTSLHLSDSSLAVLLPSIEDRTEYVRMIDRLERDGASSITLALGGTFTDPLSAYRSMHEAEVAFSTRSAGAKVFYYSESKTSDREYLFSHSMSIRLTENLCSGNVDKVESALSELWTENFVKRDLKLSVKHILLSELLGLIMRVSSELHGDSARKHVKLEQLIEDIRNEHMEPEAAFSKIHDAFKSFCQVIAENRSNRSITIVSTIKDDMRAHVSDKEYCLVRVADSFHLSESHISRIFREHTGFTFQHYLQELRMNEARTIMMEGTLSIQQIAEKVGYNSHNSFCRAFRRLYGVSPSVYRTQARSRESSLIR